jgi:NAD(P)-dependent dehydrogenase (short-subunit alcohol dehydrogenase family)
VKSCGIRLGMACHRLRDDGTPDDVAAAVLYLSGASFVTGTVTEVAGGANLTVGAMAS